MKIVSLETLPKTTTAHNNAGIKQLIIPDGEIPGLRQFSQVTFKPGEVAPEHKHEDFYEVFFVESGAGTIKLNGTIHPMTKGLCITVEPGEMHEVANQGQDDLIITYMNLYNK